LLHPSGIHSWARVLAGEEWSVLKDRTKVKTFKFG